MDTLDQSLMKKQSHRLTTWILFWCGLVVVSSLYITIPLIAIFSSTFQVADTVATWAGSSFSLCYGIGFLLFGTFAEKYGRKQMIVLSLALLAILSPMIGWVDQLGILIVLRGIQGFAAALFPSAALAYVGDVFPKDKRVAGIGFVSSGFLMSGIVGQVVSMFVSHQLGWQSVFYLLGVIYLLTACVVAWLVPRDEVSSLSNHASFQQIGRLFRNRSLVFCYMITLTILLSFVGMYTALGFYLSQPSIGMNQQDILFVRSMGIMGMLLTPFTGRLNAKFGLIKMLRAGLLLAALGLALLGMIHQVVFMIVMSVVFVAGISVAVPTMIALVGQLGGASRNLAVSIYTFILFMGATIGPILTTQLLKIGRDWIAFETLAMLLTIGWIISFFLKKVE